MDELSERIKLSRSYSGLTLDALSKKIGVTANSLKNYLKNSKNVTVETAKKIAIVCGVDLVWLLTGQGDMTIKGKDIIEDRKGVIMLNSIVEAHTDIVCQFGDQEAAMEISQDLLCIERQSRDAFEKARYIIRGIKEGVSIRTTEEDRRKKDIPHHPDRRKQVG